MTTISQELERTAHDLMTGPNFRETAEIAIAGGLLGATLGYLKHVKTPIARSEAVKHAFWGVGIGIVGQYMVFHMLKPAMRQFARSSLGAAAVAMPHMHYGVGAQHGFHGGGHFGRGLGGMHHPFHPQQHHQVCPPGTMFDVASGQCMPGEM